MISNALLELPFVFLDENKQSICPFDISPESAQGHEFKRHFRNYFKHKIFPPENITTIKSLRIELKNTVLNGMEFPEYYTTTDFGWFVSTERRGFVKYADSKPHNGIQRIQKFNTSLAHQINNPRSLVIGYNITVLYAGNLYTIELAIKDALSFKKFQQACLKYAGIVIPSIKNNMWELVFDYYLQHNEPENIGKPTEIPKNNFVELAQTPNAEEFKALKRKVADLTDRLGEDIKKTLTKRYKDDKTIMDGVLK